MLKAFYSVFQKKGNFTKSYSSDNFFAIIEVQSHLDEQQASSFDLFFQKISSLTIARVADLENLVYDSLKEFNLPTGTSGAFGYYSNGILYLKTIGEGTIFLKRKGDFARLIEGDNCASGYIKEEDLVVFTTESLFNSLKDEKELKNFLRQTDPQKIVQNLDLKYGGDDGIGIIALFLSFNQEAKAPSIKPRSNPLLKFKDLLLSIKPINNPNIPKKKTFTFIAVIIIFIIFVWSVGLGYTRRVESQRKEKISKSEELIKQKLSQAEEVSFLNLARAQALISESRDELNNLKKDLGGAKKEDVGRIEEMIASSENNILKKDEKKPQEFFDLTVEDKNAKGNKIFLSDDNLAILNKDGLIYILSLTKKSLEKKSYSEIKKASSLVLAGEKIFFYAKGEGIYKIEDSKLNKVIENDNDWGNIIDFAEYNSNLYLLDQGKNDIYKYVPTDTGFSTKKSYFGSGEASTLSNPDSLVIDQSIYVSQGSKVSKYTMGARDDFNTTYPDQNVNIVKVFTNKNVDKVYAWDEDKGVVYILGKDGAYDKQIASTILKKADDFVVHDNNIYILFGSKIYIIEL